MSITIKNRGGRVLFTAEGATSMRAAVRQAIIAGTDMRRVALRGSDLSKSALHTMELSDADLYGTDLSRTDLRRTDLCGADLRGSNLSNSDLSGADLCGTDLRGSNLSGAYLCRANLSNSDLSGANLSGANLSGVGMSGADLRGTDLRGSNLSRVDLHGTDLRGVDLRHADLRGTDLHRTDLSDARMGDRRYLEPLHAMTLHDGPHHAYKLVAKDGQSTIHSISRITYRVGDTVAAFAVSNPAVLCAAGINVATLPWCLREWQHGERILVVRFGRDDIAAIPHATNGVFRLRRCEVVEDITDQALEMMRQGTTT